MIERGQAARPTVEPDAARHHQGLAVDRFVHLGGLVPGDHPGADRGGHHGQARRPARPQGERHRRPPDPGRHRPGLPPHAAPQAAGRGHRRRAAASSAEERRSPPRRSGRRLDSCVGNAARIAVFVAGRDLPAAQDVARDGSS
ncbi:MAG: hypothetical protein MZW92_51445 [Comamonadaceae bacterium]|nr:hypothetical protein [Comamonadaceae bacterium]